MRKEFLTMMTFYIAGLVFVNYAEPLSQTTCYIIGWLSYSFYFIFWEVVRKKMSKELTDAWMNKKMEAGRIYFVKVKDGYGYRIEPMVVDMDGDLSDLEGKRYMSYASQNDILEIISLCDYETLYEELQNLRSLLKECDGCVRSLRARGVSDCNGSNLNDLLKRLEKALNNN